MGQLGCGRRVGASTPGIAERSRRCRLRVGEPTDVPAGAALLWLEEVRVTCADAGGSRLLDAENALKAPLGRLMVAEIRVVDQRRQPLRIASARSRVLVV
jgi:hypothetical protein